MQYITRTCNPTEENTVKDWLASWDDRKLNIFRALTGHNCPRSNQAEVIHASLVDRKQAVDYRYLKQHNLSLEIH